MADIPWYGKYTVGLAGLLLTIYAMIVAKAALVPLIIAVFLAVLLAPVCQRLERGGIGRVPTALAVMILGIGALVGVGVFLYGQVASFADDAGLIQERTRELVTAAELHLSSWFGVEAGFDVNSIGAATTDYIASNAQELARGLAGAASTITAALLVPIFVFFFLIGRSFIKEFIVRAFGLGDAQRIERTERVLHHAQAVVQHYIRGVLIVIGILAVLNSAMLLTIGVDHALFFGVFAAMLNVIPFLGPMLGSLLPAFYALLTMESILYPLIILGGFYVIQLFESNLFTPTIVGSQVSMNAMVTLALLFAGAQIWGLAGMILFIPMGAVVKVVCEEVESLQPIGFLMGRMPTHRTKRKGPLARAITWLSEQIKESRGKKADANGEARSTAATNGEPQAASTRSAPETSDTGRPDDGEDPRPHRVDRAASPAEAPEERGTEKGGGAS
ncbi:MAG: AI-2E family transporter [Bacteroidetes bacterium]|jgi:predicted PurR-regulated permease PerM|nr:AI-2E family transporter [Bacteroidota bacterium]